MFKNFKTLNLFFLNYDKIKESNQLEFFRIGIAMFSLISLFAYMIDFDIFLSPNGLINWEVSNANCYWFELHPLWISNNFRISKELCIALILIGYISALVSLLIGFYPRISAFFSLIFFLIISNVTSSYAYGVDTYQNVCLFFLMVFPTGYGYTLIKREVNESTKDLIKFSVRTLQIYLILTYMSAGIEKSLLENWWNGKFIYSILRDPTFFEISSNVSIMNELPYEICIILGVIVIIVESVYFIFIWIPYIRIINLAFILIMHLFICNYMSMPLFGLLLIILNVVCWYPDIINDYKNSKNLVYA